MGAGIRTGALFLALIGLFVVFGYVLGGFFIGGENHFGFMPGWMLGMVIFLILAAIFNAVSYFLSSKIILWAYKVKLVTEEEAPRTYGIVKKVLAKTDLPMPKVGIMLTKTPNAFATGRNPKNAVVAVTEGLLDTLNDEELEGVIGHELAHIKDRDILVMSVAATVAGAIAFAARMVWFNMLFGGGRRDVNPWLLIVVAITAPIAAMLVQLAISRSREYKADRVGSLFTQKPYALARALEKLEYANKRRPIDRGNPASAALFIVNPFRGRDWFVTIFSTHPPIRKRIEKLQKLSEEMGFFA